MKCEKCNIDLELVAADEPWHDEYFICSNCDGTYYDVTDKDFMAPSSNRKG